MTSPKPLNENDTLRQDDFLRPHEKELGEAFLSKGYVIAPVDDAAILGRVREHVAKMAAQALGMESGEDHDGFLNRIHETVRPDTLNDFRLGVINAMNATSWLRPAYFALGRSTIEAVVGNELCMQRRINLSIQLPEDSSSLLPVHADVWSGDSPFEAVLWLPLVDVYKTKSMYILAPDINAQVEKSLARFDDAEAIYQEIEPHLTWIDIPYGQVLLFNQNLMHGNRVNEEADTRWTMNCRFKSVTNPYADKKLGEFFEPITLRAATRIGMEHSLPEGYDE